MTTVNSIGTYVSVQSRIEFVEEQQGEEENKTCRIRARVAEEKEPVDVVLPTGGYEVGMCSVADKVGALLRNCLIRPIYETEQKKVYFKSPSETGVVWTKTAEIEIPESEQVFCHSDGRVSHSFYGTVKTRDPVDGTWSVQSYNTTKITAIGEDFNGGLVVADDKGSLHYEGQVCPTDFGKQIQKITPISPAHVLIEEGYNKHMFDLRSHESIGVSSDCISLSDGVVVSSSSNSVIVYRYNSQEQKLAQRAYTIDNLQGIERASDTSVLLIYSDQKTCAFLDVETGKISEPKDASFLWKVFQNYNSNDRQIGLERQKWRRVIDHTTVAVQSNTDRVAFHSFNGGQPKEATEPVQYGVDAMILLSDGSIMYATNPRGAAIYVVRKDGQVLSQLSIGISVKGMKELASGAVAVQFNAGRQLKGCVWVLSPHFDETKDKNYQIEALQLKIKHNPLEIDAYRELARLYEDQKNAEGQNDVLYQIYMAGLAAATQCNKVYEARRFYEKARKIAPVEKEPIQNFYLYLKNSPHKKLYRQVLLDLHSVTGQNEEASSIKLGGRCKKRLLIGEGDFSFTEALIGKHQKTHPTLKKSITATELLKPPVQTAAASSQSSQSTVIDRIVSLQNNGVVLLFGVDGQEIHQIFKGKRFERIHWNCPFKERGVAEEVFKKVIPAFFQACSHLQLPGDRIHVTLMQEGPKGEKEYWKTRQQENPIVAASVNANYRLIRKRNFGPDRYRGYGHVKTSLEPHVGDRDAQREFVFEKVDKLVEGATFQARAEVLKDPRQKEYRVATTVKENPQLESYYFDCSTDEDSSDYYDSEEEIEERKSSTAAGANVAESSTQGDGQNVQSQSSSGAGPSTPEDGQNVQPEKK